MAGLKIPTAMGGAMGGGMMQAALPKLKGPKKPKAAAPKVAKPY